jgi:hypothetical protein
LLLPPGTGSAGTGILPLYRSPDLLLFVLVFRKKDQDLFLVVHIQNNPVA